MLSTMPDRSGQVDRDTALLISVEGSDRRRPLDLRRVGHVERQRRHAVIGDIEWPTASGKHSLRSSSNGFVDQRAADAAVRAGDQDCLVRNVDPVVITPCHG